MAIQMDKQNDLSESPDQYQGHFPSLKIRDINSDILQHQGIATSFALITERFDYNRKQVEFDFLDGKQRWQITLGTKESLFWFRDRSPHMHDYLEIMLVLSGSVLNEVEQESFIYTAGQGCIMNVNIHHRELPIADAELLFICIRKDLIRELIGSMKEDSSRLNDPSLFTFLLSSAGISETGAFQRQYWDFSPVDLDAADSDAQRLLCTARTALQEKRPGCGYLVRASILNFLAALCKPSQYRLQSTSSAQEHADFLVSKLDFLITASHGRINEHELEMQLSYHRDYLNRLYRQKTGQSISKACKQAMLMEAKRLLRDTGLSIEEIMEHLQLKGRGYFFSAFRNDTGMTPREYRTRNKSE